MEDEELNLKKASKKAQYHLKKMLNVKSKQIKRISARSIPGYYIVHFRRYRSTWEIILDDKFKFKRLEKYAIKVKHS